MSATSDSLSLDVRSKGPVIDPGSGRLGPRIPGNPDRRLYDGGPILVVGTMIAMFVLLGAWVLLRRRRR